jgi:hypothetical protein
MFIHPPNLRRRRCNLDNSIMDVPTASGSTPFVAANRACPPNVALHGRAVSAQTPALLFDSVKIETGCGAFRHHAASRAKDFFTGDGETVRGGMANVRHVLTSCAPKAREKTSPG